MNFPPIANRNSGDGFEIPSVVRIVALGEIEEPNGEVQVIDDVAVQTIAKEFRNDGRELLLDFDFDSLDSEKRTTAAGWLLSAEARGDGLFAHVRWSGSGANAVKNGDYRFIAPAFLRSECEGLSNGRYRPLRLHGGALTNKPQARIVGRRLTNREETESVTADKSGIKISDWNNLVRKLQQERGSMFAAAWDAAKTDRPDLYYSIAKLSHNQSDGNPVTNRADDTERLVPTLTTQGCPVAKWENLVAGIKARKGCTFEQAWDAAKLSDPRAWVQYQQEAERQLRDSQRKSL